jgi:hypothetical protein
MKITMTIVKVLFLGAMFIVSNSNLSLNDQVDREVFIDSYVAWIGRLYDQAIEGTAYVVKVEWLPKEGIVEG